MLNIPVKLWIMFQNQKGIEDDRARFARAWFRYFGSYESGDRPTLKHMKPGLQKY